MSQIIKDLKDAFVSRDLLLTALIPAFKPIIESGYEMDKIHRFELNLVNKKIREILLIIITFKLSSLDFVNLLVYVSSRNHFEIEAD
jgi:hypothetical protein